MYYRVAFIGHFSLILLFFSAPGLAQQTLTGRDSSFRVITTAVPFLSISPDARHAALGDAGVASSADASSTYWNVASLVHVSRRYGGSISYTPWLGKIINDMWISYLTGFYRIESDQAVAFGLRYFDLGDIFLTSDGYDGYTFNPRELSLDLSYSRKLTEQFSIGLTGRYIYSNLTGVFKNGSTTEEARPGHSASFDLGMLYSVPLENSTNNLTLGAVISNVGAKISYSDNNSKDFIPTNLRLGGAYMKQLDLYNTITFLLDFNKLLVPSPPVYLRENGQVVLDSDGNPIIQRGKNPDRSLLSGIFGSFSDAPDGFKEEIKEITTSVGIEYWYRETFAGRAGYFLESMSKGNRKYLTVGLGYNYKDFVFDVAYLVPTNKREHPLAETIRFTVSLNAPNSSSTLPRESVTE